MIKMKLFLCLIISCTFLHSEIIIHKVQSGETLYGIALKYNTTTQEILIDNNLNSENITIDQDLKINKVDIDQYRVKDGDSLSIIAQKHNITLKHLLLVNRIEENYKLNIDDILTVPVDPALKKSYKVKPGDTLSWISMTYNISTDDIIKLNRIKNNNLKIGQVIKLIDINNIDKIKKASVSVQLLNEKPILTADEESYTIKKGDTLSAIALEYQTSVEDILQINNMSEPSINIDQIIKLPSYAKKRAPIDYRIYYTVKKGDTISGISYEHDISETLLREINDITSDNIKIGQTLKLIPQHFRTHTVVKGDTLWSIANEYNVSVDQLMQYNNLNSTIVPTGKLLTLYDYSIAQHLVPQTNFNLVSFKYNYNSTKSQPNKNYSIDKLNNPLDKYNKAKDKWKEFSSLIDLETPMSKDLNGWTIILDPGHGGKDPGAIATINLNGKKDYIVEDEYAYDTTVRLFELLKRNGAEVHMTILSPDHITRNPKSSSTTFLNEKNEVYNSYKLNNINNNTVWPVGGQWGLDQRVIITNRILSTTSNKKTIFISIHADNDIDRGIGKLVLYNNRNNITDNKSKIFADSITPSLGNDASTKGMSLAVLNNNNASVKVLLELRNMAHLSDAISILDNEKRQNDALMILNGIKTYAKMN